MNRDDIAVIVLAAGLSRRFPTGNKLLAQLRGKPVAAYAALAAKNAGFVRRYAVIAKNANALEDIFRTEGFAIAVNPAPEKGQGASLSIGARTAIADGAKAVLVLLADMPFVTSSLLLRLCEGTHGSDAAIAFNGVTRSPPGLIMAPALEGLTALKGDEGARTVLKRVNDVLEIPVPAEELMDIDSAEDLIRAENRLRAQ